MEDRGNELESRFSPSASGLYMCRQGAAPSGGPRCNKKLCLTATDKPFLIRLLHDLSLRDDCVFVKYSIAPRDGMYLGRCFLTDEFRIGALWRELKAHPKLMCSVQDDDFTLQFRGDKRA